MRDLQEKKALMNFKNQRTFVKGPCGSRVDQFFIFYFASNTFHWQFPLGVPVNTNIFILLYTVLYEKNYAYLTNNACIILIYRKDFKVA